VNYQIRPMERHRLAWLSLRAGCQLTDTFIALEAVDQEGKIHGAVGFDGWLGNAAQMHVAIETPIALRGLIRESFRWLFKEWGKDIALGVVPAHNERALRIDIGIGFRPVYRIKDGWAPGDDIVLLELHRKDCRWLED
jgi:hypothetical protein